MANDKRLRGAILLACAIAAGVGLRVTSPAASAQALKTRDMPVFEVDASFPQLPNNWVLGNVSKIVVDRHDNVWLVHRPRTVPADKTSAPAVVEFDANGKFIQGWGGPAAGYDWPDAEQDRKSVV